VQLERLVALREAGALTERLFVAEKAILLAVSVHYIHVLGYRDGLHVSFNVAFDRLLMLEQLGLVPAPAATQ
jgi:hypothetical protein